METDAGHAGIATLGDLAELFRANEAAPAIVTLDASGSVVTYSYARIATEIYRLAAGLATSEINDGKMVMLWAPNSPAWVIAYFAIAVAGNVVIPLDDQASSENLDIVLRHSRPSCVFTSAQHLPVLRSAGVTPRPPCFLLDDESGPDSWRRLFAEDSPRRLPSIDPGQVASLLYTSGTTGPPKAVPLTHANLMSNVRGLIGAGLISVDDRVLVPLPLHHAYPATVGMLVTLARGAALILPPGFTGPELPRVARLAEASVLLGVPRLYTALMEAVEAGIRRSGFIVRSLFPPLLRVSTALRRRLRVRAGRILFRQIHRRIGTTLRLLASGGARLEPEVAYKLEGLGWDVLTGYGLTETSPVATFNTLERKRLESQGVALSGVEIDIDKAPGDPVGEILVRGPGVFSGYWMNDAATKAAFKNGNWFRTGDLGYLDNEGFLYVVGRSKELIVLADGKNVAPEDVERVYEASPFVGEVAVFERDGRLAALIVPDDDAVRRRGSMRVQGLLRGEIENAMLRLPAHERIAEYRLTRENLPRTRLGKLRRHLLPDIFDRAAGAAASAAPAELSADDLELLQSATAGAVWQWLQRRFAGRGVAMDSSPQIDLGIDSLGWVTLSSEIEQEFGIVLSSADLSRVLTIRDLLRAIDESSRLVRAAPQPVSIAGDAERYLREPSSALAVVRFLLLGVDRVLMRGLFRLHVQGVERLPANRPFIITPNHASYLDPLVVAAALPRRLLSNVCWAGWARIMHKGPVSRMISRAFRVLPIDPDTDLGGGLRLAVQALRAGRVLVWFPEGGRSDDGSVQPFQRGIGILMQECEADAVPVRIRGSFEAWPRASKWPRLRRITVEFGRPAAAGTLETQGQGDDAAARISDALGRSVAELAGE